LVSEDSIPVQVANGQTAFTLGTTEIIVDLGDTIFRQKAHVLDTGAFEAILGLDFLSGNPRCGGVLTQPPLNAPFFDNKHYILSQQSGGPKKIFHIHKAFKTEAYTLTTPVKEKALKNLGIQQSFFCDLFANQLNAQEKFYCTRSNSAFKYSRTKLCDSGNQILWTSPPFSQLVRVLNKIVQSPCKIVLLTPNWPGRPWKRVLDKIAAAQFFFTPG
jgi:hypothetical protein